MIHCMKIPKQNEIFHREAYRAKSIEEINESAGLKYLLSEEIERAYNIAMRKYADTLDMVIVEDREGFYIELKEKR